MFATVILVILALVVIIAALIGILGKNTKGAGFGTAAGALVVLIIVGLVSSFYTNNVQQAKVEVSATGVVSNKIIDTPGAGLKAPWNKLVDFDLSSQSLTFAGNKDEKPSYSGGKVSGAEITAAVQGGAQSNFDLQLTYNIEPSKVKEIYSDYRTQENFSAQVIVPKVLSAVRKVPSQYTAIDFRGAKQGEAQDKMIAASNKALSPFGVKITVGALQNIRYSDDVEKSIQGVQVAQQQQQKAEAELEATKISAQAQVVEAQAKAKANDILSKSLSPQVLQQHYIDQLGKGTTYVVPQGSTPLVGTK